MVWSFRGTGQQLWLSLSPDGHWSAHGLCSQECSPKEGDLEILKYTDVHRVQGEWSIHSFDAPEREYDHLFLLGGRGRRDREFYIGLKAFFEKNKHKAVARIEYHKSDPHPAGEAIIHRLISAEYHKSRDHPLVTASILMPPPTFNDLITIFRTIIGNATIKYSIDLDFYGVRNPDVPPSSDPDIPPSVNEFVNLHWPEQRPYLSEEVTVTVWA